MVAIVAPIHEERGTFGVSFPDFPGCIASGGDVDEALQRGREALAGHAALLTARNGKMPRPRSVAELRSDPEIAGEVATAVLAVVDVELPGKSVRVNVTFDEGLLERIDLAANRLGESRSGFLAGAARRRLAGVG